MQTYILAYSSKMYNLKKEKNETNLYNKVLSESTL